MRCRSAKAHSETARRDRTHGHSTGRLLVVSDNARRGGLCEWPEIRPGLHPDGDERRTRQAFRLQRKSFSANFWATWCGPCKAEIPWFIEFEKMYKDRGFAPLGVSLNEEGGQACHPL